RGQKGVFCDGEEIAQTEAIHDRLTHATLKWPARVLVPFYSRREERIATEREQTAPVESGAHLFFRSTLPCRSGLARRAGEKPDRWGQGTGTSRTVDRFRASPRRHAKEDERILGSVPTEDLQGKRHNGVSVLREVLQGSCLPATSVDATGVE